MRKAVGLPSYDTHFDSALCDKSVKPALAAGDLPIGMGPCVNPEDRAPPCF